MKKLILLVTALLSLPPLFSSVGIKVSFSMKYNLYSDGAKYSSVIYDEDFLPDDFLEDEEEEITFNNKTKYNDASFDPVGSFYLFSIFSDEPIILETLNIRAEKPLIAHYTFSLLSDGEITYDFQNSLKINMTGVADVLLRVVNKYIDELEGYILRYISSFFA